jgi:hypothetical protein
MLRLLFIRGGPVIGGEIMTERMSAAEYRKKKDLSEYDEQVKLANYLDMKGYLWCHVPNGGNRDAKTGRKMKMQGVKPGVPDVLIFDDPTSEYTMNFSGIAIELKKANGKPSDVRESQKEWLKALEWRNWQTKIAFGADDAIEWLEKLE